MTTKHAFFRLNSAPAVWLKINRIVSVTDIGSVGAGTTWTFTVVLDTGQEFEARPVQGHSTPDMAWLTKHHRELLDAIGAP